MNPVCFELLVPDTCQPGTVWVAVDVLREINFLGKLRTPKRSTPVVAWHLVDAAGHTHPLHAHTLQSESERMACQPSLACPHVLVVPALAVQSMPHLRRLVHRSKKAVALIRSRFEGGALLAACGTGAWLAAHAGCIDRAPVPWLYRSGFEEGCPGVVAEGVEPLLSLHRSVCVSVPSMMPSLVLQVAKLAGLADLAHAAAEKLLLNAEREALSQAMSTSQVMGISRTRPLERAESWMQANASRSFVMAEVAQAAAISERTLVRLFREHLGQSPAEYVRDVRVKRAQMWLEITWRSVAEIARDSGYDDASAFCRMFARATGTSPKRYRDQLTLRGPAALWRASGSEWGEQPLTESETRQPV